MAADIAGPWPVCGMDISIIFGRSDREVRSFQRSALFQDCFIYIMVMALAFLCKLLSFTRRLPFTVKPASSAKCYCLFLIDGEVTQASWLEIHEKLGLTDMWSLELGEVLRASRHLQEAQKSTSVLLGRYQWAQMT